MHSAILAQNSVDNEAQRKAALRQRLRKQKKKKNEWGSSPKQAEAPMIKLDTALLGQLNISDLHTPINISTTSDKVKQNAQRKRMTLMMTSSLELEEEIKPIKRLSPRSKRNSKTKKQSFDENTKNKRASTQKAMLQKALENREMERNSHKVIRRDERGNSEVVELEQEVRTSAGELAPNLLKKVSSKNRSGKYSSSRASMIVINPSMLKHADTSMEVAKRQESATLTQQRLSQLTKYEQWILDVRQQKKLQGVSLRWIILPDSVFRLRWDLFMLALVCYYAVNVPIRIAFSGTQPELIEDTEFEKVLGNIFSALFGLDIIFNFRTAIKIKGEYVTDPRIIAKEYMKLWFFIDFVATFPIAEFLGLFGDSIAGNASTVTQLNKMLRLLRVFKVFRVFRAARILARIEEMVKFNPAILRLTKMIIVLCVFLHWVACFYWLIADLEGFGVNGARFNREDGNSWLPPPSVWCVSYDLCNETDYDVEFASTYGFNPYRGMYDCFYVSKECPATMQLQYVYSFFWAVMATTGIGDDIRPVTYYEHWVSTFLIITGLFMMSLIFGSASSAMNSINAADAEWKEIVSNIDRFLIRNSVPLELKTRIMDFYNFKLSRMHEQHGDHTVLDDLHDSLRLEVALATHKKRIQSIPIFSAITDDSCLIGLATHLEPRVFIPLEYVFQEGDYGGNMYMIVSGNTQVYCGNPPVALSILSAGNVFGEVALITYKARNATVRAINHVDALVLERADFQQIMIQQPKSLLTIMKSVGIKQGIKSFDGGWKRLRDTIDAVSRCRDFGAILNMRDTLAGVEALDEPTIRQRKKGKGMFSRMTQIKKMPTLRRLSTIEVLPVRQIQNPIQEA